MYVGESAIGATVSSMRTPGDGSVGNDNSETSLAQFTTAKARVKEDKIRRWNGIDARDAETHRRRDRDEMCTGRATFWCKELAKQRSKSAFLF